MKRTKMFKFPLDAWDKWYKRKQKIQGRIKISTGKNTNIPMTDILRFYGARQQFLWDDEINNFFLRRKKKRNTGISI